MYESYCGIEKMANAHGEYLRDQVRRSDKTKRSKIRINLLILAGIIKGPAAIDEPEQGCSRRQG